MENYFLQRRGLTSWLLFLMSVGILLVSAFAKAQHPTPLIIDADTANEVDDLYALVRAINEPALDLRGITSAQFNTSPLATKNTVGESQKINEQIIQLMDRPDIVLPLGSNIPLSSPTVPSPSPASQFIIEQAHTMEEGARLSLVILGSCTNVASAIIEDPTIIGKIKVHYLGFWHTPATNTYDKDEFNSGNDPIAVEVLLNTKELDFEVMTATTSQHLTFSKTKVDAELKGQAGIKKLLVDRWETYERWWTQEDPEKKQWVMWDVAIIEALICPEYATRTPLPTPPENTPRSIGVYTAIDTAAMEADFWRHLKKL